MNFIVTGGSRGLGKAIVLQAVKEGHNVAFTYVNNAQSSKNVISEAQNINSDCKTLSYQLDVGNSLRVEDVIDKIILDFDRIDVLVNNAGINKDNLAVSITDEEWDEVMALDLKSVFLCSQIALVSMHPQRSGTIINIASVAGLIDSHKWDIGRQKFGILRRKIIGRNNPVRLSFG